MILFPFIFLSFLVACTRLYTLLCQLVLPSIRPSVTFLNFGLFLVFKGTLGYLRVPEGTFWYLMMMIVIFMRKH